MYFPYFRGRQYELLALKELASQKLISESIIPIVEPIKQIPALKNALKAFNDTGLHRLTRAHSPLSCAMDK